jgi:hypothetical protein
MDDDVAAKKSLAKARLEEVHSSGSLSLSLSLRSERVLETTVVQRMRSGSL